MFLLVLNAELTCTAVHLHRFFLKSVCQIVGSSLIEIALAIKREPKTLNILNFVCFFSNNYFIQHSLVSVNVVEFFGDSESIETVF